MPEPGPENSDIVSIKFDRTDHDLKVELADLTTELFEVSGAKNYVGFELDHDIHGPMEILLQRKQGLTPLDKFTKLRDGVQRIVDDCPGKYCGPINGYCGFCQKLVDLVNA